MQDLRRQLYDAGTREQKLQEELSSQQRSSATSLEALVIEHKCTRDDLQASGCFGPIATVISVKGACKRLPRWDFAETSKLCLITYQRVHPSRKGACDALSVPVAICLLAIIHCCSIY